MKNELKINSSLFSERDYMVDMLERYCKRKAFANSEHEYPFTVGFTEKGDPIIENLPDLGNVLIFGDTGKTHYGMSLKKGKSFYFVRVEKSCLPMRE